MQSANSFSPNSQFAVFNSCPNHKLPIAISVRITPILPIIPTSPSHNIPQLTPEQMRIEEENRLWRIQNHFEDPPTAEPAKET